jgi:hypothetical protein
VHSKALFFHAEEFTAHDCRDRLVEKMIRPVAKIKTHLSFETVRRQTGPLGVPVALLFGVNYFFALTTTISPGQRQLLFAS